MKRKPACRCALPWIAAGLVLVGAVLLIRALLDAGREAESVWWRGG